MKKFVKILILIISISVIAFAVIKIVSPNRSLDSAGEELGEFVETAKWTSEETNNKCMLSFTFYSNGLVNMDIELNKSSTNGFYPQDEFYNCQYDSEIIFWELNYGEEYDSYASIVPKDCVGVKIDGVMYESQNGEIAVNNEVVSFKYIITDVPGLEDHKVVLIDEKGKSHKEYSIINQFD